jgi:hypothetical protein
VHKSRVSFGLYKTFSIVSSVLLSAGSLSSHYNAGREHEHTGAAAAAAEVQRSA